MSRLDNGRAWRRGAATYRRKYVRSTIHRETGGGRAYEYLRPLPMVKRAAGADFFGRGRSGFLVEARRIPNVTAGTWRKFQLPLDMLTAGGRGAKFDGLGFLDHSPLPQSREGGGAEFREQRLPLEFIISPSGHGQRGAKQGGRRLLRVSAAP